MLNKLIPTMLPCEMSLTIYQAALANDDELIRYCLRKFRQPQALALSAVLEYALRHERETLLRMLLRCRYINWANINGGTAPPVYAAVEYKREDVLQKLLDLGVNPNLRHDWGFLALHKAVELENLNMIEMLLAGGTTVDAKDVTGSTALKYAVIMKNVVIVKLLLRAGADPYAEDNWEETPLQKACTSDTEVLEVMLGYIRNTNRPPAMQPRLLELAARGLRQYAAKNVELLIQEGLALNERATSGLTPVESAIIHRNDDALQVLLYYGADVNVGTEQGTSILHVAIETGTNRAVELLLDQNIQGISDINLAGETPLLAAYKRDHYSKMHTLLRSGAPLYPTEQGVAYIHSRPMPWLTPNLYIMQLAREVVERRLVNASDLVTLRVFHPGIYLDFKSAEREWRRMANTLFTRKITFRDILEKPTSILLPLTRSAEFQRESQKTYHAQFVTYGGEISHALNKLLLKKSEWDTIEEVLRESLKGYLPLEILEKIAYYMAI